ncbi:uncharacterized protein LOC62_01G000036 [Vanrija pseudolonga]|uniref:Uncharacterized protein n=1 Tax=Vanrija pseudolonga TaxID=143232 RepID=A0AAF0XYV2_9TREE|nr:hypothetical protein LOC62_01G000036 [Vanrija pseudolonga]
MALPSASTSVLLQIAQGDREARRIVTLAKFGLYAFASDGERVLVTRLLNGDRTPKFLLELAAALGHAVIDRANLHREGAYKDLMARTLRRLARVAERLACAEPVLERLGAAVAGYEADAASLEAARLERMAALAARRRRAGGAAPDAALALARMIKQGAVKIQPQSDAEPDDDDESSSDEETLSLVEDDDDEEVPWALEQQEKTR